MLPSSSPVLVLRLLDNCDGNCALAASAVTVGVVGLGFIPGFIAPNDAYFISTVLPHYLHWISDGAVGKPSPT